MLRFLILLFLLIVPSHSLRTLSASSLVPCIADSGLTAKTFEVSFNPDTGALTYNLDLDTTINGYVEAKVEVIAYGFTIIEKTIDLCSLSFKQFCPLYSGEVIVDSMETISSEYTNMLPGIAFTVPDIDGYVKITVYNSTSTSNVTEDLACMAVYFTNGKTVSHVGAKWATAVVAGSGLLTSAVLSTFGNSNAASHISVNALSLFSYFQSVVLVAMEHVEKVPPIASAWAENLAWSFGLINVEFMQKIFRWYVQTTGGSPTLYLLQDGSELAILVQKRIINYLQKRAPMLVVNSSSILRVLRGIKRIGYNQNIEITSIVITGFTFFIIFGYILCLIIIMSKAMLELLIKTKLIKDQNLAIYFRNNYWSILKSALLRYISIGFIQLTVFSLWEFTQNDSPAMIILSILFLLLIILVIGWSIYRSFTFAKKSIETYKNPAAILYGNERVLNKYGFIYTMYNANNYWWTSIFFSYTFLKGIFIGLCQSNGKVQSLIIFIIDLIYLINLIKFKPYLDKSTNVLNILISVVTTLNSFMFIFFSNLFKQPESVSSIMGWVFFILNAGFSLILLILILFNIFKSMISKNPDSRFRRAGDDRTSFQRNSFLDTDNSKTPNLESKELFELGQVAKNHTNNWEDEMYKLKDMNDLEKLESNVEKSSLKSENIEDKQESGIVRKLSLFKRNNNNNNNLNSLTRKLSAMKMSRNNSLSIKKPVPVPNPTLKRTNSQVPMTLDTEEEDFNFVQESNNESFTSYPNYITYNTTKQTDVINYQSNRIVSESGFLSDHDDSETNLLQKNYHD